MRKKALFLARLVGTGAVPVTWTAPNEPKALKRLVRKLERDAPGARARVLAREKCTISEDASGLHLGLHELPIPE